MWNTDAASTSNLAFIDKLDENLEYLNNIVSSLKLTLLALEESATSLGNLPTGKIVAHSANIAPIGFLECGGSLISRTAYATLFAAVGTTFGAGNGSTTFQLPDLRGQFIRGWDHGRGVDSGRSFGSGQTEQMITHTHTYTDELSETAPAALGTSGAANPHCIFDVPASPEFTETTSSEGGGSIVPANVMLLYCIKY